MTDGPADRRRTIHSADHPPHHDAAHDRRTHSADRCRASADGGRRHGNRSHYITDEIRSFLMQRALSQKTQNHVQKYPDGVLAMIRHLIRRSPHLLLDSLKVLLPMSIFFIKFLEWWYSPSSPARALDVSPHGPPVPPPKLLSPHPQGIQIDTHSYGQCPLCRGPIVNATALPSGYVFCYRCAHQHVEKSGTCPVTLISVRIWQLRKILV